MAKHAGGAPSSYKPEYCAGIVEWFEQQTEAGLLPFLSKWTRTVAGVCQQTALTWTEKHPEFLEAYKKAKDIQKEHLISFALAGKYQQTFAIFTAKNITDMRDVQQTENKTDLNVTGLENLPDEKLDALIAKLKNSASQGAVREGEAADAQPA